jgi:4-cresol dehydrogenase (hydroxylating)
VTEEAEAVLRKVAPGEWSSLGAVTGTAAQVRVNLAEIRKRMKKMARVMVVTQQRLDAGYALMHRLRYFSAARANAAAIAAIRPLHGLALGVPTDAAIDNLLWKSKAQDLSAVQLDQSDCGLLFVNPAFPMDGKFVAETIRELQHIAAGEGHELFMTINIETATSLVAVINLLFDRKNSAEAAAAHRCADAMLRHIRGKGLEVYRARADMMGALVQDDPEYWATVRALKQELDPDNIIAPGRYNVSV